MLKVGAVVEVGEGFEEHDPPATTRKGLAEAAQGVSAAPANFRQGSVEGASRRQQIEAAVGRGADHYLVFVVFEQLKGALQVARREPGNIAAHEGDGAIGCGEGLRQGSAEAVAEGPTLLRAVDGVRR